MEEEIDLQWFDAAMSFDERDAQNVEADSIDGQNPDVINVSSWLDSEVKKRNKRKSTDETRAADANRKRIKM